MIDLGSQAVTDYIAGRLPPFRLRGNRQPSATVGATHRDAPDAVLVNPERLAPELRRWLPAERELQEVG